jgi:hypothetical protein
MLYKILPVPKGHTMKAYRLYGCKIRTFINSILNEDGWSASGIGRL